MTKSSKLAKKVNNHGNTEREVKPLRLSTSNSVSMASPKLSKLKSRGLAQTYAITCYNGPTQQKVFFPNLNFIRKKYSIKNNENFQKNFK